MFSSQLSELDRQRLRKIVRVTHRKIMTVGLEPTDLECDKLIDSLGPEIQEQLVKEAVDRLMV
jgi:hypothetical protein